MTVGFLLLLEAEALQFDPAQGERRHYHRIRPSYRGQRPVEIHKSSNSAGWDVGIQHSHRKNFHDLFGIEISLDLTYAGTLMVSFS